MNDLINIADYEAAAVEKLEDGVAGYFFGGAGDELTLAENVAAWSGWRLRPRVLAGLSAWSTKSELLDGEVSMPVLVAPVAYQGLRAELELTLALCGCATPAELGRAHLRRAPACSLYSP